MLLLCLVHLMSCCSGADLAGLVNQAAIRSSALGHDDISMLELEWAKDKIVMGK